MVVPVTGTIPDSTLSPFQVRQKFASLHGLGDSFCGTGTCTDYDTDETGTAYCLNCDFTTIPPNATTGALGTGTQPDGTCWPFDPSCASSGGAISSGSSATGTYMSQGGNIITTFSDGTFTMMSPSTGSVSTGHGTPPAAQQGTVTQAQANAWPQMISALTQAGVKLGTVAMLQPGQTMLANGTVVGMNQSLLGSSVNASFAAILSNPVLLIGGFGILALLAFSGGRR